MHSSMSYEELTKEICFSMFYEFSKRKKEKKREKKEKKERKKKKKEKKKKKKKVQSIEVHYSCNLLKAFYAPCFTMLLP